MNVYFNEYNLKMGDLSYLPLVSGLLQAYAEQLEFIRGNYKFMPFIYSIDSLDNILEKYVEAPHVAAFSLSMWNEQLNIQVAKRIKYLYPRCLIVFGGPQVPHYPEEFMKKYPFVDICVRAEGEIAFTEILGRFNGGWSFYEIPEITWRHRGGKIISNAEERKFSRDLDLFPSPYLEGHFDELVKEGSFQAIIETNRGCPFHCTFCYWGRGGLSRKYKYHGLDRVYGELDWCADNRIKYVFNADSNFGMNKRDEEIAQYLVDLKLRTGYPDKFRTCYGKNTDEKIFRIGSLFHKHNLEKGITLARQSNDEDVLKNIKRGNISMDTYRNLQEKFNKEDIPIYSELILGLPGETTESWKRGIEELLEAGLKNQLYVYMCQVYPNTDLGDEDYQKEFGVVTKSIELNEMHTTIKDGSWIKEYEDVVIGLDSMTTDEWKEMAKLSWLVMLMHSLKLGFFIMNWLHEEYGVKHIELLEYLIKSDRKKSFITLFNFFDDKLQSILEGHGRGCVIDNCGGIYWDVEEAAFISLMEDKRGFYQDFLDLTYTFLYSKKIKYDNKKLLKIFNYQMDRIPTRANFDMSLEKFAKKSILWGRKSGTMLLPEKVSA